MRSYQFTPESFQTLYSQTFLEHFINDEHNNWAPSSIIINLPIPYSALEAMAHRLYQIGLLQTQQVFALPNHINKVLGRQASCSALEFLNLAEHLDMTKAQLFVGLLSLSDTDIPGIRTQLRRFINTATQKASLLKANESPQVLGSFHHLILMTTGEIWDLSTAPQDNPASMEFTPDPQLQPHDRLEAGFISPPPLTTSPSEEPLTTSSSTQSPCLTTNSDEEDLCSPPPTTL